MIRSLAVELAAAFALVATVGAGRAAASTTYVVYKVEAEAFAVPTGASIITDSAGNGGKAVVLRTNSTLARSSTTPTASTLQVRAAGDQCDGAPRMQVRLDGVLVLNKLIATATWTLSSVSLPVQPRTHLIAVKYTNDYSSASCDRNLRVDSVTLRSTDAINSGTPGSRCEASDGGLVATPAPADISTSMLGSAPAYYEYGLPTGAYAGLPPKGITLVIHGGGWYVIGAGAVAVARADADRWRAFGWATLNLTYRACAASVDDVVWFADAARAALGDLPMCAMGSSAGGHLALMLATQRTLACGVSKGGPTDLAGLSTETAYDKTTGGRQAAGPTWTYHLAVAAFGPNELVARSPINYRQALRARLLLATAEQDPFVPLQQADDLADAVWAAQPGASVEVLVLGPGPVPFVHASVGEASWQTYLAAEGQLATSAAG